MAQDIFKKKIIKLSVRQKVRQFFNLYDFKDKFILSCVEFALAQNIENIRVKSLIKNKNKLRHGKVDIKEVNRRKRRAKEGRKARKSK